MEKEIKEIWKDIIGYEGLYQISDWGNVKSLIGITERILKPGAYSNKYNFVNLYKKADHVSHSIHRLIAIAFIENPQNKKEVNHKNGIKTDNRIENLEWVTRSENIKHTFDKLNRKHTATSKPIMQVSLDGFIVNVFDSKKEAKRLTGIHTASISKCINGKYKKAGGYIWI